MQYPNPKKLATDTLPINAAKSCRTCIARDASGHCHMNPVVVFAYNFGAGASKTGYPECPIDGWCMQHQPKPVIEPKRIQPAETLLGDKV